MFGGYSEQDNVVVSNQQPHIMTSSMSLNAMVYTATLIVRLANFLHLIMKGSTPRPFEAYSALSALSASSSDERSSSLNMAGT